MTETSGSTSSEDQPGTAGAGAPRQFTKRQRNIVIVALFLFIALFIGILYWLGQSQREALDAFVAWGEQHPVLVIPVGLIAEIIAASTPIAAELVTGANCLLHGFFWGMLLSLTGVNIGTFLGYILGRYFQAVLPDSWLRRAQGLREKLGSKDIVTLMGLRCIPIIPMTALNIAAGLSSMPLGRYMIASFFGTIPLQAFAGLLWVGFLS